MEWPKIRFRFSNRKEVNEKRKKKRRNIGHCKLIMLTHMKLHAPFNHSRRHRHRWHKSKPILWKQSTCIENFRHIVCNVYFHRLKTWSNRMNTGKHITCHLYECRINESAWDLCRRSYENNTYKSVNFFFVAIDTNQKKRNKRNKRKGNKQIATKRICEFQVKVQK